MNERELNLGVEQSELLRADLLACILLLNE